MSTKNKKAQTPTPQRPARDSATAPGSGGMLQSALIWLIGPISKENAIEWVKIIVFAVSVALLIRWPIIEPFKIPSGSMEPTLNGDERFLRGDRVFVNKWIYGVRYPFMNKRIWRGQEPQRWDIVVFKTPEENAQYKTLVKRIVALPGERVHVEPSGHILINGEPIEPPPGVDIRYGYTSRPEFRYGVLSDETFSVVPDDHYLVLGDNRGQSRDGRVFGWLPNGNILGRVACIAWPPGHWRDFTGFSQTLWWRTLVAVTGLLILVRLFFGRSWHVRRGEAATGVDPGDHLYVNRAAVGLPVPFTDLRLTRGRDPRRGELVLYRPPSAARDDHEMRIGRVAAFGGEEVYIDDGRLTVNGKPLDGPASLADRTFAVNGASGYGRSKSKEYSQVPEGHYFIVDDEDGSGSDSRAFGWIARRDVVGTVPAVWWPPRRWRRLRP